MDAFCSDFTASAGAPIEKGGGVPVGAAGQLQALAGSFERRERRMAETSREQVTAEVRERARALGVTAPVEALTDLLVRAGYAGLDRDRCLVEKGEETAACREAGRALDRLEDEFPDARPRADAERVPVRRPVVGAARRRRRRSAPDGDVVIDPEPPARGGSEG